MIISFAKPYRQGSPILSDLDKWIFLMEAENTPALIWMSKLSRMLESHNVNLCHLFYHIVFYFKTMFSSCLDGQNIAGI